MQLSQVRSLLREGIGVVVPDKVRHLVEGELGHQFLVTLSPPVGADFAYLHLQVATLHHLSDFKPDVRVPANVHVPSKTSSPVVPIDQILTVRLADKSLAWCAPLAEKR